MYVARSCFPPDTAHLSSTGRQYMAVFEAKITKAKSLKKVLKALKDSIDDACIYSTSKSLFIRNLAKDPLSDGRALILELHSDWFEDFTAGPSPRPFCISIHLLSQIIEFAQDNDFCQLVDNGTSFTITTWDSERDRLFEHVLDRRYAWHLWAYYMVAIPHIPDTNKSSITMSSDEFFRAVQHLSLLADTTCVTLNSEGLCMTIDEAKQRHGLVQALLLYHPHRGVVHTSGAGANTSTAAGTRRPAIPIQHLLAISRGKILSTEVHLSLSQCTEDPADICVTYKFRKSSLRCYVQPRSTKALKMSFASIHIKTAVAGLLLIALIWRRKLGSEFRMAYSYLALAICSTTRLKATASGVVNVVHWCNSFNPPNNSRHILSRLTDPIVSWFK
ncbi:hypothetical protein BJ165DRAFT_1515115 [Panaeolus papilionaceus]|nr:hypothetical protein BJ165DRAFT_1515115 [Panaeolus papilionaceus]